MAITVQGFPASQKTPGYYFAVILGGPGTSPGTAPNKQLHVGNMIGSALTGASPSFTVAAGTATLNVVYQVFSASQSALLFGAGSELHLMALAAFAEDPAASVWQVAVAQGTGQATGVITATGSVTAAVTARIVVCGRTVDVSINVGDSLTTIATNLATAINQQTNWPVTAQNSAGVVTLSAKHVGLRGSNITFRVFLIAGASSVKATAGALAAALNGLTLTLSGGTAVGGVYKLAGGSTEESLTTALAVVASTRFHRYVLAQQGSTALAAVVAQLNAGALPTSQLLQQAVAASVDTYANAIALTGAQNAPLLQLAWHYNADVSPGEIAAQVAAGRLAGDAAAGGAIVGEASDCAANLDGLRLTAVPAQDSIGDQPLPTQVEAALNNGLTPLVPTANGFTAVPRSITTMFKDGAGNPNYAVIDTEFVTVCFYEADLFRASAATQFAGGKLAPDTADGSPVVQPKVFTPRDVRSFFYRILKDEERAAHITSVDAKAPQLAVALDPAAAGRALADVPIVPIANFHQLAVNVRQLAA